MKTSDKILRAVEREAVAANSDKKLLLGVWDIEGLGLSQTQRQIFLDMCTPAESITRKARELTNEGKINRDATKRTRKHRQTQVTDRYRERSPFRPISNGPTRSLFDPMESD